MTKHIYGITAPIGSGKTTVLNILKDYNFEIINTDELAKEILKNNIFNIAVLFPECVNDQIKTVNENGNIVITLLFDTKKYSNIIFTDNEKRKKMEDFIYPILIRKIKKIIKSSKKSVFIESAILFETNIHKVFNFKDIIFIDTNFEQRMKKVIETRNLTKEEFLLRDDLQLDVNKKLQLANIIITNTYNMAQLKTDLLKKIKEHNIK